MSNDEFEIINVLREEYNKRIKHFLEEKITVKDKRGYNLVKDAVGLKVRDKAGFEYTIGGIVKKGKVEYMKLYLPEFGRDSTETPATSGLNEFQTSKVRSPVDNDDLGGFISRSQRLKGRDKTDINSGFVGEDYLDDNNVNNEEKKYILVPMNDFEDKFEI